MILTTNNKLLQQKIKSQQIVSQQKLVKFYLRKPNKSTIIIQSLNKISGIQLLKLTQQKTNISINNICLFLKGEKIQNNLQCYHKQYRIKQLDIVHVHNLQKINKNTINVTFQPVKNRIIKSYIQITVNSNQKIKEIVSKFSWYNQQLVFVLSSRKLDINKTFKQQLVEDLSIISVTNFNAVKIDEKTADQQKFKNFLNIMQINLEQKKLTKSRSAEYQDIKKPTQTLKSLRKSVTLGNISNNAGINLSFKKKQKPSIYKSMKITQSKEIIWESDSSGDLNRILRKQIPIKKHKNKQPSQEQIKQITEQKTAEKQNNKEEHQQNCIAYSDEEEIQIQLQGRMQFSNQDRIDLQNQLSKLLFSDNTQAKPQVTQLQPPQMFNDDFLQQAQQMQIHSDEDEDQDQDEDLGEMKKQISNQQLRSSFDLRQSIGKSRGTFVVPTLIMPTKDFQNFDEEQDQQDEQFESLN